MATAQLFLGNDAEACRLLGDIRPKATSTGYLARSIGALLDRRCN
jgi:hypothetical protein